MITTARFKFTRTRRAWYIETDWFWGRFYPPTMPRWDFHRKRRPK